MELKAVGLLKDNFCFVFLPVYTKRKFPCPLTFLCVFPCRGPGVCCGVWLQVHRDLGCPAPQREGSVRGHRAADPPAQGQQGGQRPQDGQHQEEGEHQQKGQALPRQDCGKEQQEDGFQSKIQVVPRPVCAIGTLGRAGCCTWDEQALWLLRELCGCSFIDNSHDFSIETLVNALRCSSKSGSYTAVLHW